MSDLLSQCHTRYLNVRDRPLTTFFTPINSGPLIFGDPSGTLLIADGSEQIAGRYQRTPRPRRRPAKPRRTPGGTSTAPRPPRRHVNPPPKSKIKDIVGDASSPAVGRLKMAH
ncbi:hypothetical protein EVAR_92209_1 [Eumeta japonica]|uniref:Uncharacterized protein n=1 Tax=Eumeta variegata TaxID=151549 RepID=A0A4C1TL21_EUMVA|nr:hypothetical protein EVAR_92209_1 [Eumeta japonica]